MGVWACERNRRRRWRLFGKHLPRQRRLPYETSLRPYVPTPRRPDAHTPTRFPYRPPPISRIVPVV
jgi:hypothetical protein